mgnify:CR=1 FL=1
MPTVPEHMRQLYVDGTVILMSRLKRELDGLLRYIQHVRQEVAMIDRPGEQINDFESMGNKMATVVKATESNNEAVAQLHKNIADPDQLAPLNKNHRERQQRLRGLFVSGYNRPAGRPGR